MKKKYEAPSVEEIGALEEHTMQTMMNGGGGPGRGGGRMMNGSFS